MYRAFKTVEEVDEYVSRTVYIEDVKAVFVEAKINKYEQLHFTFEYEDGTIEILDSETSFAIVKIDGHTFGKKIKTNVFRLIQGRIIILRKLIKRKLNEYFK